MAIKTVVLFLFINSVYSKYSVNRVIRGVSDKYSYHPPLNENYEAVPVAIVYDNNNDNREAKKIDEDKLEILIATETTDAPTETTDTPTETTDATTETTDAPTDTTEDATAILTLDHVKKSRRLESKYSVDEVTEGQIPVQVIYDETPGHRSRGRTGRRKLSQTSKNPEVETTTEAFTTTEEPLASPSGLASESPQKLIETVTEPKIEDVPISRKRTRERNASKKSEKPLSTTESSTTSNKPIPSSTEQNVASSEKNAKNKSETSAPRERTRGRNTRQRVPQTTKTIENGKTTEASVVTQKHETSSLASENPVQKSSRTRKPIIPILKSRNLVQSDTGSFVYSYESGDGTIASSRGELKSLSNNKTVESVSGSFSYTDKDGQDISLTYTADENGYHPVGAHLPTPPPIPPAIARALAYLATKTTPAPVTKALED